MANEFEIQGLDGVLRKMREISPKLQRKGLVAAVRKGANIVRDDARNRAKAFDDPSTPKPIWREIVSKVNGRRGRQEGGVVMQVGIRGGARESGDNVFYWRFLEFGTSKMAARPFMRPALESNVDKATDAIVTELKRQLDEVL
jgi:HK97 gp10 family phage protein